MFHRSIALICLIISLPLLAVEEPPAPVPYTVTPVRGYLYGTVDGKTAYQDWRRGTFDKERMNEVKPADLPSNLPKAVIIPYINPKIREVAVGKPKQPPLKGEDKIFVQIGSDEKKARCLLLGQGCEALHKPKEQDSVYYRPIKSRKQINP